MSAATTDLTIAPDSMTHEEAVARARALAPGIGERALRAEADRRIPLESVREIVGSGIARLLTPRRWAGYELGFDAAFDVAVEVGKACGSTAWITSFLNVHAWILAGMPEQAQVDVWGDGPDVNIATSFAPMGEVSPEKTGYRLSGNWAWCSGVDHCEWAIVGCLVFPADGEGPPDQRLFLIPKSDYTVLDTWFNVGLAGTGSNNIVVQDVFVPEHRVMRMAAFREGQAPGATVNPGPLYQVPMVAAFMHALTAPALGIARGAYEQWRDETREKVTSFGGSAVAEYTTIQIRLATAAAEIDAAELLLRRALDVIRPGTALSLETRARSRRDWAHAAQALIGAVDLLLRASGARGLYTASAIQRAWRDLHTIACHVGLNPDAAREHFGRLELGLERNQRDPFF